MASARRQDRNDRARVALDKAAPPYFPRAVLLHAWGRPFVPARPRHAIESYWRAHPLRADRLARALAARSGAPAGWRWQISAAGGDALPRTYRTPPAPYREPAHRRPAGHCCLCGQPVFRFGWHRDLWGDGKPNGRASWHACCVAAWRLWTDPQPFGRLLRRLQRRRCGVTGETLQRAAAIDIDHRTPLYAVWRGHREAPWPGVLRFWGLPNLQAVNRPAHRAKCAGEAADRARSRAAAGAGAGPAPPP